MGQESKAICDSASCCVHSFSLEALKTLMRSSGYIEHLSYIQTLGVWDLLVSPEKHYDGVTLLAR